MAAMADNLERQVHDLLFGVRRSSRYHMHRRQFFESCNTLTVILSLIGGSGAFIMFFVPIWPWLQPVMAGLVSLAAAVNLAIGTVRRADHHGQLARQFIELEMQFAERDLDKKAIDELTKARLHIEMEEPPIKRLLDALCHFELLVALGYETKNPSVPLWRRAMMHVVSQASYARKLA